MLLLVHLARRWMQGRKRESKGELTRRTIVARALGIVSDVGYEGLSIGALAEESKLSKSGLFAHFRSRAALERATLERAAERFRDTVLAPAKHEPAGLDQVTGVFRRWLDWPESAGLPGSCPFFAAAFELDDQPGPARDQLIRVVREFLGVLAALTEQAVRRGQLAADTDAEAAGAGVITATASRTRASTTVRAALRVARPPPACPCTVSSAPPSFVGVRAT